MKIKVCIWDREPKIKEIAIDEVKEVPVGTVLTFPDTLRDLGIYIFTKKSDLCLPYTFHLHQFSRFKSDRHIVLKEINSYGGYGSLSAGAKYEFKVYDADPTMNANAEVVAVGKWSYDYSVFGGGTSSVTLRFIKPCFIVVDKVLYIVR
jgi:hypothetical protein